jgi:acyl-ACP thioesterase
MDIFENSFPVAFDAVDSSNRVRLDAIFDFFQDAATAHAEALGVGKAAMTGNGQGWVLSRMVVDVRKRPAYTDRITVRSWPRGWSRLFAIRDFDIRDEAGETLVAARSGWIIVDINSHRPLRPGPIMDSLPLNEGRDALTADISHGLPAWEGLTEAGAHTAAYTDIDGNGHTNNARYIEWMENTLDNAALAAADSLRCEVNYLSEVMFGEKIGLFQKNEGAVRAFEARRDATPVFKAELRF